MGPGRTRPWLYRTPLMTTDPSLFLVKPRYKDHIDVLAMGKFLHERKDLRPVPVASGDLMLGVTDTVGSIGACEPGDANVSSRGRRVPGAAAIAPARSRVGQSVMVEAFDGAVCAKGVPVQGMVVRRRHHVYPAGRHCCWNGLSAMSI